MERSRHGEGDDSTSHPLPPVGTADQPLTTEPPVPEASAGDLSGLEDLDTPTIPGYLMLEENSEALGLEFSELFDPETPSLELPELFAPEASTIPGYLTLEIDPNALADDLPWESPNNAASDEPGGKR